MRARVAGDRASGPRRSGRCRRPARTRASSPMSCEAIAAVSSTSEFRRGCSVRVSSASVADRHGVLEQAAEVGVVAAAGAGRAPQLRAERLVVEERGEQRGAARARAPRARGARGSRPAPRCRGRRPAGTRRGPRPRRARSTRPRPAARRGSARHAPFTRTMSPRSKRPGEEVGVAERARGDRAGAVAQLERQVGRARPRGQAILARAREQAVHLAAGAQLGDRDPVGGARGHVLYRERRVGRDLE